MFYCLGNRTVNNICFGEQTYFSNSHITGNCPVVTSWHLEMLHCQQFVKEFKLSQEMHLLLRVQRTVCTPQSWKHHQRTSQELSREFYKWSWSGRCSITRLMMRRRLDLKLVSISYCGFLNTGRPVPRLVNPLCNA